MKPFIKILFLGSAMSAVLCGGCMARKELVQRRTASLPQLIRFFKVSEVKMKPGVLFISGQGSAAADGGKNAFTAPSPFSSYPFIRMTIKSDNAGELESCLQRVQVVKENHQTIDIRGMGVFTIESVIDPPVNTGVFTLTHLDACGAAVAAIPEPTPAADLVAVPERFIDRKTVITGYLVSPVQFKDPVSSFIIGSEGQSLSGYFLTSSLVAESRLSLVHAAPGSILVLEGTWARVTPKSLAAQSGAATTGYEFDVTAVVSVKPAK